MVALKRLFIANRGEVAARIARTCDAMGITPVFGVSLADINAPYVRDRQKVVLGKARSSESYLCMDKIVQAALQTGCSALHPGWGFLAEDPRFVALCQTHGLTFVGPTAESMSLLGKKSPAKRAMKAAGLNTIEGSDGPVADAEEALSVAKEIGFPVLLKAESGGGGRGMRIAHDEAQLPHAFDEAQAEAQAAFGDPRLFVEKLIVGGRHIEVQVLGDKYGNAVHFGERDCSVQRKHQKLIEESSAIALTDTQREQLLSAAVVATANIGYVGAGTLEFLQDSNGQLRFMEMNTRLQVEHTVSEMRAGVDLVEAQLRVAAGERLWLKQSDIKLVGHAIECRINAEDPNNDFAPSPGVLQTWRAPVEMPGVRVDTHVEEGYEVPPFYDSLLCKMITHGKNREDARNKMIAALNKLECKGVSTTVPLHLAVLQSQAFIDNDYDTRAIPGWSES